MMPLTIIGTDLRTGETVLLERGNLIDAILGSIAIPGVLPPVTIEGREIIDGGLANNVPLDVAAKKGARLVLAMRCGCRRPLASAPRGILGILSRSFDISINSRYHCDIEPYKDRTRFVVFEPCLEEDIGLLDFSHSAELIEIGYRFAQSELKVLMEHWEQQVN
jgi:NTE family protein